MQAALLQRISRTHRDRPADYRANLPGQDEFLSALERRVIWFGHNGGGKTEALARRFVRVFEGIDPICAGVRRPLSCLLIVTGYDAVSCRDFAKQLHDLMPRGLVAQVDLDDDGNPIGRPSEWYGPAKGFRGRPPRIVVQRGPMRGTVLNISTLGSGTGASAGGTIDLIGVNEPISQELYDELVSRDRAGALGFLWYVLTPIPGAPSQVWIPETVARLGSSCRYIQTRLTPEALTFPSGRRLEPWQKTSERIAGWSSASRPMRMGESLEPIQEDAFFASVWRDSLVIREVPEGSDLYLIGNLDHGLIEGRMRVGVTGYRVKGPVGHRRLVAYDLIDLRGTGCRIDEMADLFLRALDEAGMTLENIDEWVGDRAIVANVKLVKRDNYSWRGAVQEALRRKTRDETARVGRALWDIRTPKKKTGSSVYLTEQLRSAMGEEPPRIYFLESCTLIQADIQKWDGSRTSEHKDGIDRLGYSWEAAHRHFGLWRG